MFYIQSYLMNSQKAPNIDSVLWVTVSTDTTFKGVKQFAQQAVWNLLDVHNAILEYRIEQMHYSNKCHKPSIEYQNKWFGISFDKESSFAEIRGTKTHA